MSRTVPAKGDLPPSVFLGVSSAAHRVREQIRAAAATKASLVITGETGVGKEVVAREVHLRSPRAHAAFVALNCSAIPDSLLESEIFGHEAGAFTDAKTLHRGSLERAHRGTMFLDEIGDLSPSAQPKLLRALEAGETLRVGGEHPVPLDVRFIAATNQSLRAMCHEGRFRLDLYYRLHGIEIAVPPLRHRREDILLLAEHFARQGMAATGLRFQGIAPCSTQLLTAYPWHGNVRELRAVIERAIATHPTPLLEVRESMLDPDSDPRISLRGLFNEDWQTARQRFEAAYAAQLLDRHGHNVKKAADAAGVVPRSLYKMLRRLGLRPGPPCGDGEEQA